MILFHIYHKYPLSLVILDQHLRTWIVTDSGLVPIRQEPHRLLWTPAAVLPCWQPVTAQAGVIGVILSRRHKRFFGQARLFCQVHLGSES